MISYIVLQVRVIFSHYFSIFLIYVLTKPKSFLNDSKIDPNRQTLSKQASPISSQLNEFLISARKKPEKSLTKNSFQQTLPQQIDKINFFVLHHMGNGILTPQSSICLPLGTLEVISEPEANIHLYLSVLPTLDIFLQRKEN